jgi:hypothetical protein
VRACEADLARLMFGGSCRLPRRWEPYLQSRDGRPF